MAGSVQVAAVRLKSATAAPTIQVAGVRLRSTVAKSIQVAGVRIRTSRLSASAGSDRTGHPGDVITLTGSIGTTDPSTVATITWTLLSSDDRQGGDVPDPDLLSPASGKTATTLKLRPGPWLQPVLYTYQMAVTSIGGATVTDTVVVGVAAADVAVRVGGQWLPAAVLRRSGGAWV